jgi:hypothetical protein
MLKTRTCAKKCHRVIKEAARFAVKVMFKLKFEFNVFYYSQHLVLHVRIWCLFIYLLYLTN